MVDSKILAVGTVAVDSIKTPRGSREKCFGGSASYFSYAASFFSKGKIVAVVGEDFPQEYFEVLKSRNVDISGIEIKKGEKTFFWQGKYEGDMNTAQTLKTELNVLLSFDPQFSEEDDQPILFLANIDPEIQLKAIHEKKGTEFTVVDTMNFWIENKLDFLKEIFTKVDAIIINEGEAELLTGKSNLIQAGEDLQKMGPKIVVLKKGANGVILFHGEDFFALPAYPVRDVVDPTGAGDSFAGGMVGYLAQEGKNDFSTFKQAITWGTVVASFTVEGFSLERLKELDQASLESRKNQFLQMIQL